MVEIHTTGPAELGELAPIEYLFGGLGGRAVAAVCFGVGVFDSVHTQFFI